MYTATETVHRKKARPDDRQQPENPLKRECLRLISVSYSRRGIYRAWLGQRFALDIRYISLLMIFIIVESRRSASIPGIVRQSLTTARVSLSFRSFKPFERLLRIKWAQLGS